MWTPIGNALFDNGRSYFLQALIPYLTGNIQASLLDLTLWTPNLSTSQFISEITSGAVIATSANFAHKTATAGVAVADGITYPTVTGPKTEGMVIYQNTGNPATSPLIAWIDTGSNLPVVPNGGDITVTWASLGIFKL